MIQLTITETGKGFSPKSKWQRLDDRKERFSDMQAVKAYLKATYGKCKRVKMYVDKKTGESIHCGYIYSFHNSDMSHSYPNKWIQQDWVHFEEIKTLQLS